MDPETIRKIINDKDTITPTFIRYEIRPENKSEIETAAGYVSSHGNTQRERVLAGRLVSFPDATAAVKDTNRGRINKTLILNEPYELNARATASLMV